MLDITTTTPLRLGEITVQRVVEIDRWAFAPAELFPAIDAATVAAAALRWGAAFVDPDGGELILNVHSYVVRTPSMVILIDTCNGNHKPRPFLPPHHMLDIPYLARLRAAGVAPEDVDLVLCTHLHPDHIGWNTRLVDGRWVPTFPNARYVLSEIDFAWLERLYAAAPGDGVPADLAAAFADSVLPVIECGQAVLVAADHELDDTVRLEPAPGHTAGHVVIHVENAGAHAVVTGDVIHHPLQLAAPGLVQAGDADPATAVHTRRALIEAYAGTPTVLLPGHFPGCRVVDTADGLALEWL